MATAPVNAMPVEQQLGGTAYAPVEALPVIDVSVAPNAPPLAPTLTQAVVVVTPIQAKVAPVAPIPVKFLSLGTTKLSPAMPIPVVVVG